jgi:hypothetical protein
MAAKTYPILPLMFFWPDESWLSFTERREPEGASQTFVAGSPLKAASGLMLVWVSTADAPIFGFSLNAATGVSGTYIACFKALPEMAIEGTLLASGAATTTLANTDLGLQVDLVSNSSIFPGATAGWFFQRTTVGVAIQIDDFRNYYLFPDASGNAYPGSGGNRAFAGDTNPRVSGRVIPGKSVWF